MIIPIWRLTTLVLSFLPLVPAYAPLSNATLARLPSPGTTLSAKDGALLTPLLIPRVPGTPGSTKVLEYLADFFRTSLPRWTITFQNSTSKTPGTGDRQIPFVNLIATRDPPGAPAGDVGRLVLAAHYDSKREPEGFIGATDSAAPVAMILHAVRAVDAALTKKWETAAAAAASENDGFEEHVGFQVILFDGEEAFVKWTDDDSLYGSRSLAETWESTYHPALSTYSTPLASISMFVLLDLLGAADPRLPSYYPTTHWAYEHLATLESRLRTLSLFDSHKPDSSSSSSNAPTATAQPEWFSAVSALPFVGVGDDHLPFLHRGVDVLHLIPEPFPRVWHQMDDDGAHLHPETVNDWARLVTAFVAEWFELDGLINDSTTSSSSFARDDTDEKRRRDVEKVKSKTEL
ncbi:MAG: hypothetical protein M1825_005197 [Sarcosagium campestre]|nr:MAG: hypothetical protein M1825_005197 [Sarcosagium campestre]